MPFNVTPLEDKIVSAKPAELSHAEETNILQAVRARVAGKPVASPLSMFTLIHSKSMLPIILILALTLGAGGTVAASDGARPGDILFPIDRAIEDLRISVAGDEEKQELRIKFADERLREFNEIAGDDTEDLEGELTEAEADIFTDETVVKLEAGDHKVTFITDADTREEIIDVIHDRYGFPKEDIDEVLSVDIEDRESTPEDRDEDEDRSRRLTNALEVLGEFIEENRGAASTSPGVLNALAIIESRILDRSAFFPEEIRMKIRDDRARYEVRGENGERVRVEFKDGEIRVKTKDGDDNDDEDDRGRDRDEDDEDDDRDEDEGLEIEADIFTDITTVEVELNDRKTSFTTDADTREEIIDAIQARFPSLSESEIDAALDLEVEDRASREDDRDEDEDDDSDGDRDEDKDDDRDEEDEEELEIEAEVHSSSSSIEVEIDGVKTRFSTTATTREGIIDAIEARFSELSESEIDAVLELEFDDEDEEDEDDSDEDSDDDDEDEDDEEDDD